MIRSLFQKPAVFLGVLYTLAWAPMLVMRGAYWDGWVFYSQFAGKDYTWVYDMFAEQSNYHHYLAFRVLDFFPDPVLAMRCIVFTSWFLSGLLLLRILRRTFEWDTVLATLCIAYYLVFPVFIVRFAFIHAYYSPAMLFFMLAAYLYLDPSPRSRIGTLMRELDALALFVASFLFNVFLAYFFAFLGAQVFLFAKRHRAQSFLLTFKGWLRRYWYLPLLPILFFLVKTMYFHPYGASANYGAIIVLHPSPSVLSQMLTGVWGGLYAGFLWPVVAALQLLERKFFAAALVLAAALVWYFFREFFRSHTLRNDIYADTSPRSWYRHFMQLSKPESMLIFGALFLCLALSPYLATGKFPHIYGYGFGLRHSLLMPLGCALTLLGLIRLIVRKEMQRAVHIGLLSLSIAFLWYNFFLLDIDWYKQQAILAEIPRIVASVPPPATFVFTDEVPGYNWLHRDIGRQEYDGYLDLVTGTHEYRGVSMVDYQNVYRPAQHDVATTHHIRIISERAWTDPRVSEWVRLKWIELFRGETALRAEASRILQIALVDEGPLLQTESVSNGSSAR